MIWICVLLSVLSIITVLAISFTFTIDDNYSQSAQNVLVVKLQPNLNAFALVEVTSINNSLIAYNITNLDVDENKFLPIELKANATGNLTKVPLDFSIVQPKHGVVSPMTINDNGRGRVLVKYIPTSNYTGKDNFTFSVTAANASPIISNGTVSLEVNQFTLIEDPGYRAAVAFVIALIFDFLIFLTAYLILKGRRKNKNINIRFQFWDIIRDGNWYPSLPRFQVALWTAIIIFAFAGIALFRLFSGVDIPASMPSNIFLVLGLTATTLVAGTALSEFKYAGATPPDVPATKEIPSDKVRKKLPKFKTMLMEYDKISLSRFQMFAWTWVGIISYLGLVFLEVNKHLYDSGGLIVPDLPTLLIVLMGIGQGAYLGTKSVKPPFISINEVRPGKISLQKEKNFITILGSNFGTTGSVWLEYYTPVTEEEMQHCPSFDDIDQVNDWIKLYRYQRERVEYCYDITPKTIPTIPKRQDTRIVTSLDDIISNLKSKEMGARVKDGLLTYATSDAEYVVRVERDGLLTYPISDATLTIANFAPIAENLSYSSEVNKPVEIQLKATDLDADKQSKLTYIIVSDPKYGNLAFDSSTGKVTYTPKEGFVEDDGFTFKANDGKVDGNTATVKIIVKQATNHPVVDQVHPSDGSSNEVEKADTGTEVKKTIRKDDNEEGS